MNLSIHGRTTVARHSQLKTWAALICGYVFWNSFQAPSTPAVESIRVPSMSKRLDPPRDRVVRSVRGQCRVQGLTYTVLTRTTRGGMVAGLSRDKARSKCVWRSKDFYIVGWRRLSDKENSPCGWTRSLQTVDWIFLEFERQLNGLLSELRVGHAR